MQTPANPFKQALQQRQAQIGFWLNLANPYSTEVCAGAGFDWLLVDGEHSPNDLRSILAQLHVIAGYPGTHAVARIPVGETALIKQYLDLGLQSLLVPMVDTPEQARALVQACRYPPDGVRGMAGTRAARWGRYPNYAREANAQICLLVQAETRLALSNLDAILAVEGIDGVFIGPADLSASLGHLGHPGHRDVRVTIDTGIARILAAGKAPGILAVDEALATHYMELGARFVAVGVEATMLARATRELVARFRPKPGAAAGSGAASY
jgi:4-hydroxy-2-oxoheptanedioate aldolase